MSTAHLLPTFARVDLAFDHGEGCWLTATNGERYLDFTSGVAVNALGHAHPKVAEAIAAQAHKAIHVSNLFRVPEQEQLAERLCALSGMDNAFFTASRSPNGTWSKPSTTGPKPSRYFFCPPAASVASVRPWNAPSKVMMRTFSGCPLTA